MTSALVDLRYICAEVTSALRYAESKHGVFMAFNGAAIFGGFGALRTLTSSAEEPIIAIILHTTLILLSCAMLTSMSSFLPKFIENATGGKATPGENILFFEHIKMHTVDSYIDTMRAQYGVDSAEVTKFDRCLILQIIVNAQLTARKFRLFRWAAYFDLAALFVIGFGFLLNFIIA